MSLLIFVSFFFVAIGQNKSQNYGDLMKILEKRIDLVYDSLKYNQRMDSLHPSKRVGNILVIGSPYLLRKLDLKEKMDTLKLVYIDLLKKRQIEIGDSIFIMMLSDDKNWKVYEPKFNPPPVHK